MKLNTLEIMKNMKDVQNVNINSIVEGVMQFHMVCMAISTGQIPNVGLLADRRAYVWSRIENFYKAY